MDDPESEQRREPAERQSVRRVYEWYNETDHWGKQLATDILVAVLIVAVLGSVLFAASGVWPPLVAVESGSMEPNINEGDLVFVVDADRYVHSAATADGIVTADDPGDHQRFNQPGTVIVFHPDGAETTPIIHRAKLAVEDGEEWVDRADPDALRGESVCAQTAECPAPHAGYITKGDDNAHYDVVQGQSGVVKPEWIHGKAVFRVPYLGYLRLALDPSQWPRLLVS